ncbi:hypothetical protein IAI18_22470 [Acetobacteraceae bacterium H6797]|nr:hypothetical protein [Acetobacteraceae bacterium H6797]
MSLDLALSNARSGLALVNRQLSQTADNVANAGTAGYTRKVVNGSALVAGSQGSGVRSLEVSRQVDSALLVRIDATRAGKAASDLRQDVLQGVELAHGDPNSATSLGDLIGTLRSKLIALRDSPSEPLKQSEVVSAAGDTVNRLHSLTNAVTTARQRAQDGLVDNIASLNQKLADIAALTTQIKANTASGQSVATLEDQRDAAVSEISGLMEVRAVRGNDGGITLIGRGGLVLPIDASGKSFSVANASVGPDAYYGAGGMLPGVMLNGVDVTSQLLGGEIGENIALRDKTLPGFQAEIDIAAGQLAQRFDAQGLTLFVGADGSSLPDMSLGYTTSGLLGFAGSIQVNPAITVDTSLVRDGTRDVADGENGATAFTANPAGGPESFTILLDRVLNYTFGRNVSDGVAQATFPTTGLGPAGDLTSKLSTASTIEDYAGLVTASQTAVRSQAASQSEEAGDLLTTLETTFSNKSGVDIDTEMAAMVTLQNAYAANARILSVAQSMYDSLFQAVR